MSYTKNLMEHLGKNDYKGLHDKRNTTHEGLAHKVLEQNKECIEIGLASVYVTFWLRIPWILCVPPKFE